MTESIDQWVEKARNGDKESLEMIILEIQNKIYNLSVRMLGKTTDAEDATQEILIKVITNLSGFRKESKFTTWVYRIASNHLLNLKKKIPSRYVVSMDTFDSDMVDISKSKALSVMPEGERKVLEQEVRVTCFQAMLFCLENDFRLPFVLATIFRITSDEGAEILSITPEAFRKRISRARQKVANFMENKCGLINEKASCRCSKKIDTAIRNQKIDPKELVGRILFPLEDQDRTNLREDLEQMDKISKAFIENACYPTPQNIMSDIITIIQTRSVS